MGSMGDDTPLAMLSPHPQGLYRFFAQRFAQVTNPPIDSLRERAVMSLRVMVGRWGSLLDESEELRPPGPLRLAAATPAASSPGCASSPTPPSAAPSCRPWRPTRRTSPAPSTG